MVAEFEGGPDRTGTAGGDAGGEARDGYAARTRLVQVVRPIHELAGLMPQGCAACDQGVVRLDDVKVAERSS
ncbi:MAG TPA: hypothetical protein VHT97_00460 [Acidimicrobiales bacterium]|nr:hypothetical protein [Acidimicrobiales bacterium]